MKKMIKKFLNKINFFKIFKYNVVLNFSKKISGLPLANKGFDFILYNQDIEENDSTIFSKNPHKDFLKVVKWLNENGEYSR